MLIAQVGVVGDLVVAGVKALQPRQLLAHTLHHPHPQDVDAVVLEGNLLDLFEEGNALGYPLELACADLHCLHLQGSQPQLLQAQPQLLSKFFAI